VKKISAFFVEVNREAAAAAATQRESTPEAHSCTEPPNRDQSRRSFWPPPTPTPRDSPEAASDSAGAWVDMGLGAAAGRLLPEVDWEREAYPAYDDFLALPAFVLFFPTVRFFLDRFVFEVRPPSPSSFLSFFRSAVASVRFLDSGS